MDSSAHDSCSNSNKQKEGVVEETCDILGDNILEVEEPLVKSSKCQVLIQTPDSIEKEVKADRTRSLTDKNRDKHPVLKGCQSAFPTGNVHRVESVRPTFQLKHRSKSKIEREKESRDISLALTNETKKTEREQMDEYISLRMSRLSAKQKQQGIQVFLLKILIFFINFSY